MRIDMQMRTFNDPKQTAIFKEMLQKSKEENAKKLKCFTTEQLEDAKQFRKQQQDILDRKEIANINTSAITDNSKTTFPDILPGKALGERAKVVDEYYAKQNEINKKFASPEGHIWRKYYDRKYPYYVKGLTNLEREIVYENELKVLGGKEASVCFYDPILQEKFGSQNALVDDIKYNQTVRDGIKNSINQLFEENDIVIPKDVELQLVVDPYDQKIYALGVDDELADKIEMALNKGRNGEILYRHIEYCNPAKFNLETMGSNFPIPEQYRISDPWKRGIFLFVKHTTGLDMRNLKHENGKFYTPDGEDLWDAVTRGFQNDEQYDPAILQDYYKHYLNAEKNGWNVGWDANRVIGYKNGDLYDIDTEYGYGENQKAWQKDIIAKAEQNHQEYRKQREKTLKEEESKPTPLEELYAQYGLPEEQQNQYSYYGKDGKIYTKTLDNEVAKQIDALDKMLDMYVQMANQMRVPAKARPRINYIL